MESLLSPLADELGDLEAELAPLKAKITRADALRKLIRTAHKTEPSDKLFTISGARWLVLLGPCAGESLVDTSKLFQLAGAEVYLKISSVSLKEISAHCTPATAAAVVSTTQTGTRPLTVVPVPEPVTRFGKRGKR